MEHNEFKDQLYEVLDENDVALGIEDIDTSDAANIFTIKTRDGSVFEIETRKIESEAARCLETGGLQLWRKVTLQT